MKSYQCNYESAENFEKFLNFIKSENNMVSQKSIMFYIAWTYIAHEKVHEATHLIDNIFPDSIYYGNEASGNISAGKLHYGVTITCYIFESPDTKAELLWIEEGTEFSTLSDLWNYCRGVKGLKGIELNPSLSCLSSLQMDNSVPEIDEDICIFGGASVNYDDEHYEASVIAKGHPMTDDGMSVILYSGDEFNISISHVLGWKGLGRYMQVSKSHDKVISEIDGQPAFSIYEKYLDLKDDDRANIVFPLIVEEDGVEYIRTPQRFLEDKSMRMFVDIPEGALVRIAYGDKNTILNSLLEQSPEISNFKPQVLKAYSCAARRMFWGDEEIYKETLPLQDIAPISGFYTGGELVRFKNHLRALNSTLVVVCFREGDGADQEVKTIEFEKNDKSLISKITHFVEAVSKEQQDALELAEEEKHRNDIIHDIIHSGKWAFFVDADDNIIGSDYSQEVLKIVDVDLTDQVNDWTQILHPEDKEAALTAFMATVNDHTGNTPYDVTYRMRNRAGEYHWFHSAGRIIRDASGAGEFYGIHIDISDQIEAQLKSQKQLQEALEMADAANRAKTEFLFNMSHDIRTPMNAILGFTNMAMKYVEDKEKIVNYLLKTQQSGDLLLSLINSVLEVSRIESGKAVLEEEKGDIFFAFTSIENTMRVTADSRDISLRFEYGRILDRFIYCDFHRLERVLVNIISNAIKYTNAGGYVLIRCEQLGEAVDKKAEYRYTIEDNGIGMSEEFQKHVFEQFSRERSVTVSGIQGTGLGMAVCKSFVDLMGGTIECESELGKGTTFTMTLPLRVQDESEYLDPKTMELMGLRRGRRCEAS